MNKKVLYGKDAREKTLSGVNKIADAVISTLGPMGRLVLIAEATVVDYGIHSFPIHVTKDGNTCAKAFDVDDPFEKAGVIMAKECAQKTVDEAGDGTTSSILLMRAIIEKGVELVNEGANPMQLKRDIDKAVEYVVGELKKMAIPIKGNIERIRQVATVSANNDSEIGDWIAKAFEKIGDEGVIDLEASKSVNTEIKIADGYKWDNGWVSPLFVNNKEKQITEFVDPFILLYEKKINHHSQVQRSLEIANQKGRPILIICEDAEDEGLAFLVMNTIKKNVQCCVVKAPSFGYERRIEMEDLAMLTGGTFISDSKGVGIKDVTLNDLGAAKKVIISKDETVIVGGEQNKEEVESLLNELRMNLAEAKNEEEKAPIEKRIARITGGVAVIYVGAATETEMKEKLDRFDDSVRAVKSAIDSGYLVGAGTSLLRVHQTVTKDAGWNLIMAILDEPLKQICKNAGIDSVKIIEEVRMAKGGINFGYNAKKDIIEDLEVSGIIDAAKVVICALKNAASSASMILTSEVLIADTF